jgi:metacaspase-1
MSNLTILSVHGVGHAEANPNWYLEWQEVIQQAFKELNFTGAVNCPPVAYDDLFDKHYHGAGVYAGAVGELLASAAFHGISDWLHPERAARGLGDEIRWRVGMVAQFVVESGLRKETRARLLAAIQKTNPDVICAHSLGSLLCYDLFMSEEGRKAVEGRYFISFGSQIGNFFVKSRLWAGRIQPLDAAKFWFHIFNPQDPVFTAKIKLDAPNFEQIIEDFKRGHDAVGDPVNPGYLDNPQTKDRIWRQFSGARTTGLMTRGLKMYKQVPSRPRRRALLVGINDYPDPANQLEGCVNDVFLMSSVLQESDFAPEDIRVVLNERATRQGIIERLEWLLDGVDDQQERVFFYSGHGAQIPAYGPEGEVDHLDECLVPYDFNWTNGSAFTDKDFCQLYSQLPYGTRFLSIFDCCHSGGLTRDGSRKVRGITPPDDIRHRLLRWSEKEEMWTERELKPINSDLSPNKEEQRKYLGKSGATQKLGRAAPLRTLHQKAYNKVRKELGHSGPFLPVIFEACKEEEYSYEYRHGVTSYGAFTYAMAKNLRARRRTGKQCSFEQLIEMTNETLQQLKYNQTAQLIGPSNVIDKPIPGKQKAARGG